MGILVFGYPLSKTTEAKYKGFEITQALEGCTKLNINGEKVTLITLPYPSEKRLNEVIKGDTEREQQISYSKKVGDFLNKSPTFLLYEICLENWKRILKKTA